MDKKKRSKLWLAGGMVLVGTLLFCSGMKVGAATNEPGSEGDPIITRSYLEQQLGQLENGGYRCITLKKGEVLSGAQGAQVILYTGTATVIGSLIDITTGTLVTEGAKAEKYHSYLVPADGSGFTAQATCVIFLSGETY